jgi:hypothetical protein
MRSVTVLRTQPHRQASLISIMVQTKPEAVEGQNFRKTVCPLDNRDALCADPLSKAQVFGFVGTGHSVQVSVKYRKTPHIFVAEGERRAPYPLFGGYSQATSQTLGESCLARSQWAA